MAVSIFGRPASRRRVLQRAGGLALGAVALGGACVTGAAAAAAAKHAQKSVSYQDHPKGGHGCNSCKAFQPPSNCKTVETPVAPGGWCDLYEQMG